MTCTKYGESKPPLRSGPLLACGLPYLCTPSRCVRCNAMLCFIPHGGILLFCNILLLGFIQGHTHMLPFRTCTTAWVVSLWTKTVTLKRAQPTACPPVSCMTDLRQTPAHSRRSDTSLPTCFTGYGATQGNMALRYCIFSHDTTRAEAVLSRVSLVYNFGQWAWVGWGHLFVDQSLSYTWLTLMTHNSYHYPTQSAVVQLLLVFLAGSVYLC
mmetsp:Transcript_120293/g.209458  ORF Transcript_120293/g.209458 Transcript_120293/m.209458 type:complete len:212 (+) Transcript_120293:127-762(+)